MNTVVEQGSLENQAIQNLVNLLRSIPVIEHLTLEKHPTAWSGVITATVAKTKWQLLIQAIKSGQPKYVRQAALLFHAQLAQGTPHYPLLIAPWLSLEARAICQEADVGYFDLAGNCRLSFGGVYIERTGFSAPRAEKRDSRSLFGSKTTRALRILLQQPSKAWKVAALAKESGLSLGAISNVSQALLAQEWATRSHQGLYLTKPQSLLEAWLKAYKPPKARRLRLYSLNTAGLDKALQTLMPQALPGQKLALASFSAARWWAPYVRQSTTYLYANEAAVGLLEGVGLKSVPKGENVVVDVVEEDGVFIHQEQVIPGLFATSPLQTYLDLAKSGERGLEAAQHLLHTRLLPAWGIK